MNTRRDFLTASGGLVTSSLLASPLALMAQQGPGVHLDQSTLDFWINKRHEPSKNFSAGITTMGAVDQPEFVFFDPAKGFQTGAGIDDSSIPKTGTSKVTLRVQQFRPSQTSKTAFLAAQNGTLRVDVKQTTPLPDLSEVLAWSSVAAFVPKSQTALPDLKDLTFDPGQSWGSQQSIPITKGLGFWSWNFFLQPKDSLWAQLISEFRTADKVVFPLMGMPAIAVTALNAVDKLFAYILARRQSNYLFQSVEMPIYTTQEGKTAIGQGLPLKSGQYLVLPRQQLSTFGASKDTLTLSEGYLVAKGTDPFDLPKNAALQIPTLDYLSISVTVA